MSKLITFDGIKAVVSKLKSYIDTALAEKQYKLTFGFPLQTVDSGVSPFKDGTRQLKVYAPTVRPCIVADPTSVIYGNNGGGSVSVLGDYGSDDTLENTNTDVRYTFEVYSDSDAGGDGFFELCAPSASEIKDSSFILEVILIFPAATYKYPFKVEVGDRDLEVITSDSLTTTTEQYVYVKWLILNGKAIFMEGKKLS